MYYKTYANLKTNAPMPRIEDLVKALEAEKCQVHLDWAKGRLEVDIPDEKLSWVINGYITVFFSSFQDIADWSFHFQSPAPNSLQA